MFFNNQYLNKKVVVIGHTGFKGSWLTLWLKELGAKVSGFSIDIPSKPSHFELANIQNEIVDVRGDITNYQGLLAFLQNEQPEIVFHLGARAIVSDCIENPQAAFLTNAIGTVNVLQALREVNSVKACVIITSDKCYENVEWPYGYRECDRLGGKDPYSASKACAEIVFSSYFRTYLNNNSKLRVASARAGNVIGGGDWAENRIVPDCIRAWTDDTPVKIRNPNSTRPWQHVLEPLSGYLSLGAELLKPETKCNGESYNFGPDAEVNQPVTDLIMEMKKYWSKANYVIESSSQLKNKEATLLKLCCDKALSQLNWKPTMSFQETVELTANWYKLWTTSPSSIHNTTLEQIRQYQRFANERSIDWANS